MKFSVSFKLILVIIIILFGIIPMLLQNKILISAFKQAQIDARIIEVQNQSQILSTKMTRAGYMQAMPDAIPLDNEMDIIADLYNGRIVVVDKNFRIIRDTFNIALQKTNITEEVLKCFLGENSNKYDREKYYLAQTFPVYDNVTDKNIEGVMVVTASTESMADIAGNASDKSNLFMMLCILVLTAAVILVVTVIMRPYRELQNVLNSVADGNLEQDISENSYKETRDISSAVNTALTKLKAVDKSREEFVSNVSHELKTPITSIRVLADSLMGQDEVPVELYREFMVDISDEIDRESKIIDDLLSLVKMDKSASDMNIEQININALMELILKRLRPIAQKRNIELIFESIREVLAEVDEVKLSLALNNLVENAIKYNIEDGWVRVTLDADHKFFYVKVADSGIGIPEEFQAHVFERFYRVDKARSRETGGTGLGLAITQNVILMHHGVVKLTSKEGEGTTFTVRIPLTYIS